MKNGVIFQAFHWYLKAEDNLWQQIANRSNELAKAGFTALWTPPPFKGSAGDNDVGYGPYDLYDLGEFEQKGSIRTKYGTRKEFLDAIKQAHENNLDIYADVVLNHRAGADDFEEVEATKIDKADRNKILGNNEKILAPTKFTFPERKGEYSKFNWNWTHFDAVDYNKNNPDEAGRVIYLLQGKSFDSQVDIEFGNFDYLMFADLDMENPEVLQELKAWGDWFIKTSNIDGFRFDAVKHIQAGFFKEWVEYQRQANPGKKCFSVGEYWHAELAVLQKFIGETQGYMSLFDVPLHFRFYEASKANGNYDMSTLLSNTLLKADPVHAVTFVDNHDTQPGQALASFVEPWFKPLAYAIILLREEGYPCVFGLDYDGGTYTEQKQQVKVDSNKQIIDLLLDLRRKYAHGEQRDYFDHFDVVGWARLGDSEHPKAMAVLLSDGADGFKDIKVDRNNATFKDLTGNITEPVKTDGAGAGRFPVKGRSVSVWIEE